MIEAPDKARKVTGLIDSLRRQPGKSAPAIAEGTFRVLATGGGFRRLVEQTPYFEPPRNETSRVQSRSEDERVFVLEQIGRFLEANPAARRPAFTIARPGGWNPDPEANPSRYLAIAAPASVPQALLPESARNRRPFEPWFVVESLRFWNELGRELGKLDPDGTVWLATDDDEEGEAIAWHVVEAAAALLPRKLRFARVRMSALAVPELREAFLKAGNLEPGLIAAQQVRERLDRIVGYCGSRAIWALGFMPGGRALSLGRVQLASLLLLASADEQALQRLPSISWSVRVEALDDKGKPAGWSAGWSGDRAPDRVPPTKELSAAVAAVPAEVRSYLAVQERGKRLLLYTLDRLQTDAHRIYNMSAKAVLDAAQSLYSRGLQAYPRSDSDQIGLSTLGWLRRFAGMAGVDASGSNVVRTSGAAEQGAHEAIVPLDTPVAKAMADQIQSELSGGAVLTGPGLMRRAAFAKAWREADGPTGDAALQVYDLVARRSMAALFDAPALETRTIGLSHPALPTVGGKPVTLSASATRFVAGGEGGHAVLPFHQLSPEKGGQVPAGLKKGDKVPVELARGGVKATARSADRPTIQGHVRPALVRLGIGRPSSTAEALETLERRGYVRATGEDRHGLSRFGALVTGLARNTLRGVVSLQTTSRLDRLAALLREAPARELDALVPLVLSSLWGPVMFERLKETRLSAYALGNLQGPGLSQLAGFFPGPGSQSADAMHRAVRAIAGVRPEADAELDEALSTDLALSGDRILPASAWQHHGSLRWLAGQVRGSSQSILVAWRSQPDEYSLRLYWSWDCPLREAEVKRLTAEAARLRARKAPGFMNKVGQRMAETLEEEAAEAQAAVPRALFFTLLSVPARIRETLRLLIEGLAMPLAEASPPRDYVEAWGYLIRAAARIRTLDRDAVIDPDGVLVDIARPFGQPGTVWSLGRR